MEENMQGESSMDEKAFLLQEIRYSKRKQNVKKFLRYESTGIAAGGTIAMVLEGCAVFVPFYTVHVWAVLAVPWYRQHSRSTVSGFRNGS